MLVYGGKLELGSKNLGYRDLDVGVFGWSFRSGGIEVGYYVRYIRIYT